VKPREALAEEFADWADGQIRLQVRAYLSTTAPPLELITSVRCVLLKGGAVLVQRDIWSSHVLPGGRREAGDASLEATLRREVPEAKLDDGVELDSTFMSSEEVRALPLRAGERVFLDAALAQEPPSP
jgi:hypothetical protein